MNMPDYVTAKYRQRFQSEPAFVARAPGRVNLLGEHVDYNDGFVLPAAIDRATWVAFSPSNSDRTTLVAVDLGEEVAFAPDNLPAKTQADGAPLPEWARYPAGVMWALNAAKLSTPGMNAVFTSDIPRGAGLSSSAALELAFGVAWQKLANWTVPPMELALLGQRAENTYVGVNCGIMDQFASACGKQDRLLHLDCRSLEWQSVPLPEGIVIVIADTAVRHSLTTSAYNERRAACEQAVSILKEKLPGIRALRDVSPEDFNRFSSDLPEEVQQRARHVVEEIERSRNAVDLLENADVVRFGELMNTCHASLRDLYEVSCPELDVMAEIAQSLPGCYGARLTGAGFGGCTVNLVARDSAGVFAKTLAAGYEQRTGLHPEIYICRASEGAGVVHV
jgi:galactokinase